MAVFAAAATHLPQKTESCTKWDALAWMSQGFGGQILKKEKEKYS